jgi:hypothetical protein
MKKDKQLQPPIIVALMTSSSCRNHRTVLLFDLAAHADSDEKIRSRYFFAVLRGLTCNNPSDALRMTLSA